MSNYYSADSNSGIRKFAASAIDALSQTNWNDMARPSRLNFVEPIPCLSLYQSLSQIIQKIKVAEYADDIDFIGAMKNVLRGESVPEDMKASEAEIVEVVRMIVEVEPTGNEFDPWSRIWLTPDKQTSIQYVEEYLIDSKYFIVKGKDREKVFNHICNSLDVVSRDEVKQILQKQANFKDRPNEYLKAIYNLGLIATPGYYEQELYILFEQNLFHIYSEVKYAVMIAMFFANWREFIEPLEYIKNRDSDPKIQELADRLLYAFSQINSDGIEKAPTIPEIGYLPLDDDYEAEEFW